VDTPQAPAACPPGKLVRTARRAQGLTLAQLGARTGYSAAQVSRYERGISRMADVAVLRRFAAALDIPPAAFGLTPAPDEPSAGRGAATGHYPLLPTPRVGKSGYEEGDAVRRRRLLANLAATAAAATGLPLTTGGCAEGDGQVLVNRLGSVMLGLCPAIPGIPSEHLPTELQRARTDYRNCDYAGLAARLPRAIHAAHQLTADSDGYALLIQGYLLATRVLIKVDEAQLGWMAADRARQLAQAARDPLAIAEAARQLAVLARSAGWTDQAAAIALQAADDPSLRQLGPAGAAQRGLLVQSAAYTVARAGDRAGMRQLTAQAAAIAKELGPGTRLRDHGGFGAATVQLHLISAETSAGDPSAAIAAADRLAPQALPSIERRARYHTDRARAYAQWGRREECVDALLAAERTAPQETRARPAVKALVSGLLVSGRTTPALRGLAARTRVVV
jgi:transcriptional regulator with XRE-family HTH domain